MTLLTDRQTDRETDGRTDGRTDGQTDRHRVKHNFIGGGRMTYRQHGRLHGVQYAAEIDALQSEDVKAVMVDGR